MFQRFEDSSQGAETPARLVRLRQHMAASGLDAFLVPRADAHQGEYVAPRDERLAFICGFTGSAGMALITRETALLFVDGRYTLQAREQAPEDLWEVRELPREMPQEWIRTHLPAGSVLGLDPWLTTPAALESYQEACGTVEAEVRLVRENPIDAIWDDQPPAPQAPLVPYPLELAGESAADKRRRLTARLDEERVDAYFTNLPDEIAWSFNLRGADIAHTPVALGFALITAEGPASLFFAPEKVNEAVEAHSHGLARFLPPEAMPESFAALAGRRVLVDARQVPVAAIDLLEAAGAEVKKGHSPVSRMKAVKNAVELKGFRRAHRRDGVAMTRFLQWLEETAPGGGVDEITACRRLEAFRAETGELQDIAFDTISAAGPHGAIVHYRVTQKSNRKLAPGELYLVDSGGQYRDGTTDITRTVAVGTVGGEERRLYTLVLKGHIALARMIFPAGTSGAQLDVLARQHLWQSRLDYAHGTGHGVGHYLSVHEGPAGFSRRAVAELEPGMVLSNEPGYYRQGAFGIRLENLLAVVEESEGWLGFETLTLAPFDRRLVEPSLLDAQERAWLDAYHARVREEVGPLLPDHGGKDWLERATAPIGQG